MAESLKIASYGQGLPIVLIHGWGLNSGVWQSVIEHFPSGYQLITADLPGFGTNHHIELNEYSIDIVADKIAEKIVQPAIYLGWSMGGLVATKIAQRHAGKVLGLVTVASSPCFVEQENWRGIKPEVLTGFYRMLSQDTGKTIDNFLKIQAMGSPNIRQDIKKIRHLIMQYPIPSANTLHRSLALLEHVDLRNELFALNVPLLRLYGRLDSLVPKEVVVLVTDYTKESSSYIFEKASHAPFISHEKEFIDELQRWLKQEFPL